MKKVDITNVQEAGEFPRLTAGAYICTITGVEDVEDKEYLKVSYDIAQGEFKNYYSDMRKNHPDWAWIGSYVKSYKVAALPMFKRFCSAVSKSNGNYVFDGGAVNSDEKSLIGKQIGLILRDEEYYSNSGDVRTRLIVHSEFATDKLADQKVPEPKKLPAETKKPNVDEFIKVADTNLEEVPW